jgi:hypothetical protein
MNVFFFEDAVTAANLNAAQRVGVYYMDGLFANHSSVRARLPHADLYGITVHGLTGPSVAFCDCEKGDMTPAQAEAWVAEQVRLNVPLIGVYANLSTWQGGLLAALAKYGPRIKRWVAHYDGFAVVPPGFDAKQFANPGPVDRNIALGSFLVPFRPKPDLPHGHAHFEGTVDIASGKIIGVHGLPGVGVHFAGAERWLDVPVQIQIGKGGGHWRAKP